MFVPCFANQLQHQHKWFYATQTDAETQHKPHAHNPTITVTCPASVLGSMTKRMTLIKLSAALTISLVRDASSRHTLCRRCSIDPMSIESDTHTHTHFVTTAPAMKSARAGLSNSCHGGPSACGFHSSHVLD